jgi:hypothetical protein
MSYRRKMSKYLVKHHGACTGKECFKNHTGDKKNCCPCYDWLDGCTYHNDAKAKEEYAKAWLILHPKKTCETSSVPPVAQEKAPMSNYTRHAAESLVEHRGSCWDLTKETLFNPCRQGANGNCPCWKDEHCAGLVSIENDTHSADTCLAIARQWLIDNPSEEKA